MRDVGPELLEPAPVAFAGAEVLAFVASEPLTALDGEQPEHGRDRERGGDQPVAVDPAHIQPWQRQPHSRASAASAKWRACGAGEVISNRTAAT